MAAPNLRPHVPAVRVWDASLRVTVVMDADDPAFLDHALDEDG